jgi:hypothetical protein
VMLVSWGPQTKLCTRWMSGDCRFGDRCNFAHGEHELRSLPPRSDDFGRGRGGFGGPPRGGYGGGMGYGAGRGRGRVSTNSRHRSTEREHPCPAGSAWLPGSPSAALLHV